MAKVHIILQGKGGVGKSAIAALIAQYKIGNGDSPICIDTDPVNATFDGYKALNVRRLEIMEDDDNINTRKFDELVEIIAPSENDVIIDNGASSFVALASYLKSNQVAELLQDMGHEMVIHTVVTGGQAVTDTVSGFAQIVTQFPEETTVVVWVNPYWGPVEKNGKQFREMKAYIDNKERVSAVIELPTMKAETEGYDFSEMLKQKQTFEEAAQDESKNIMAKQRLKIAKQKIFSALDEAAVM